MFWRIASSDSSCASAAFCVVKLVSRATTVPAPLVSRSPARVGVALGLLELGLVLADLRFDLGELRLQGAGIELEQQVAFLDQRAFLDIDLHDLAVEARLELDRGNRLHRADGFDDDRHRLLGSTVVTTTGTAPARIGPPAPTLRLRHGGRTGRAFSAALAAAPKPSRWATSSR